MGRVVVGAYGLVSLCVSLVVVPSVALAQADPATAPGIESAGWLAGCWEAVSPNGQTSFEEQWMAPRGGMMVGMSRTVREGVSRGYELATIRVGDDGRLVYHAEPSGQSPADFPARSVEDGRLEFVNTEHDFPQKIIYSRPDTDVIHATVFGKATDTEPAFMIPYQRVECGGD